MSSTFSGTQTLSAAELDGRLEKAVRDHERSEKLICIYLNQLDRRKLYRALGFENVYDYALERFGFCRSKTRALLYLGRRLSQLPALTEALAKVRIGWTKAAKVASVATPSDEREWTERAVASSFRDLERQIRDEIPPRGGRFSCYLNAEQAAILDQAIEICRRVSGEEIDPGLALEYIAGEFLATYLTSVEALDRDDDSEPVSNDVTGDAEVDEAREERLCPDGESEELPSVEAQPYRKTHREVLQRDGWRCQYPGCSVRRGLHVHHIRHRSRFGKKGREEMDDASNLIVLCACHHRMLHAGLIGLTGSAPGALEWRRPAVMETAAERHDAIVDEEAELEREEEEGVEVPNVWQTTPSGPGFEGVRASAAG